MPRRLDLEAKARKETLLKECPLDRKGRLELGKIIYAFEQAKNLRPLKEMLGQPDGPYARFSQSAKWNLSEAIRHFELAFCYLEHAREMFDLESASIACDEYNEKNDTFISPV